MAVAVNMPQMAAGGLSESWLFKFAGDLLWQALCRDLSTPSRLLASDGGERLYSSFIAIAARYSAPLAAVEENDVLDERIESARWGSSFFHGHATLASAGATLRLEMLTAFVSRVAAGDNELRRAVPAARFAYGGAVERDQPALLSRSAQLRKGTVTAHQVESMAFALGGGGLGLEVRHHPSPYVDFNGANLLYYAAYPAICDAGERRIVMAHDLVPGLGRDWALATSTVARDVFYYKNLDLSDELLVQLHGLLREGDRVGLHTRLLRASDRQPIAELFTVKQVVG